MEKINTVTVVQGRLSLLNLFTLSCSFCQFYSHSYKYNMLFYTNEQHLIAVIALPKIVLL